MSPKGPPSIFFDILQQNGRSKSSKGSPLLHFSVLCDLLETFKKFGKKSAKFFSVFFPIFRHSATSFRQKDFSKGSAFIFSGVLRQNGYGKIPKGPPFSFFSEL